jgi:hypothetical protein
MMSGKSTDCYIDVWRDANFEGETLRIEGPAEHPDLKFVNGDWGDQIGSLRVGPHAFVLAYRDKNYESTMIAFGPNQDVANLDELKFDDEMDSMKIIDSMKILDYKPLESEAGQPGQADAKQPHSRHKGRHKGRRR